MSADATPNESLVGTVLEAVYRIVGLLGEGGMGAVYEAEHLRLHKRVAVKVMARELAANVEALNRFHREALVTSALGHPHIVQVFDFSTTPTGAPFMVMEFLEGEDLEHRLRRAGRLSPADTLHIVKQVASALAATHAKGIVHRDLKPGNIYLLEAAGETDFVKVLDFGISKVRAATTKLTTASMVMGTPNYMSPEQALGKVDEVDETTDQWALACIAWECLSGQAPFVGENVPSILFQVVHEPPPPLVLEARGLASEAEDVLRCALTKDKRQRFASVAAFATALGKAITQTAMAQPGHRAPVAPTVRLPDASATSQSGTSQSTTFTQTVGEVDDSMVLRRSVKRRLWAVVGATVVVVSIVAFVFLRLGASPQRDRNVPIPGALPVLPPPAVPAGLPLGEPPAALAPPPLAAPEPLHPVPALGRQPLPETPKLGAKGKSTKKDVAERSRRLPEKAASDRSKATPPVNVAPTPPPPASAPPSPPKGRRRLINDI